MSFAEEFGFTREAFDRTEKRGKFCLELLLHYVEEIEGEGIIYERDEVQRRLNVVWSGEIPCPLRDTCVNHRNAMDRGGVDYHDALRNPRLMAQVRPQSQMFDRDEDFGATAAPTVTYVELPDQCVRCGREIGTRSQRKATGKPVVYHTGLGMLVCKSCATKAERRAALNRVRLEPHQEVLF